MLLQAQTVVLACELYCLFTAGAAGTAAYFLAIEVNKRSRTRRL